MKALLLLFSTFLFWAGSKPAALRPGKDYALFFAVKDYKNTTSLKNPIKHAVAIAAVLHDKYGFDTLVVRNPTRKDVIGKLAAYRENFGKGKFDPNGQLFIFFTGHGKVELKNGYFLPADADPADLDATAIGYHRYREYISDMPCKHILVGIDACYSGYFDPFFLRDQKEGGGPDGDALPDEWSEGEKLIEDLENNRTRRFLTSAGETGSPDDFNQFAARLLKSLQNGGGDDRMLKFYDLWTDIEGGISPVPRHGIFGDNDPASTFIFFEKPQAYQPRHDPNEDQELERMQKDNAAFAEARKCGTIACFEQYLRDFPLGYFADDANRAIEIELEKKRQRKDDLAWEAAKLKDNVEGYKKYLADQSTGRYRSQAAQRMSELEEAAKSGTGSTVSPTGVKPSYPAGFEHLANDLLFVQGGEFQMGDLFGEGGSDEKVHSVTLSSFYMSRYEVTVRQFAQFINDTGYKTDAESGDGSNMWNGSNWSKKKGVYWKCDVAGNLRPESDWNHPVIHVSWNDAVKYCEWLSKKTGKNFRLPTEAEWEFAARERGKKVRFGNGKDIADPKEINFDGSESIKKSYSVAGVYRQKTTPVGSLPPANSLGLFDMSGNVWEWCSDWYGDYSPGAQTNPKGAGAGTHRVCRGGSWGLNPSNCRSGSRSRYGPSGRVDFLGFRLALAQD